MYVIYPQLTPSKIVMNSMLKMNSQTSAQTWDHSGHDLQGIMPARSSHDNLIDFTPLGDPAALLGLHLGSDSATIAHGHASLPQLLPQHPPLLSSPATAAPQFSQHPDPRRHWDAWNPLLVTNPQPSLNLQPVPIDSRPVHSYQQSAPSAGGTLYNRSVRLSDSGYVSNSHAARSVSAASSYAVDTSCSPQLASHQGPEFAENFCSSPVQERETSMQHVSELIRCDHPNCSWTGKCPSDKRCVHHYQSKRQTNPVLPCTGNTKRDIGNCSGAMNQTAAAKRASEPSTIWPGIRNASTSRSPSAVLKSCICALDGIAPAKTNSGHGWIISNSIWPGCIVVRMLLNY